MQDLNLTSKQLMVYAHSADSICTCVINDATREIMQRAIADALVKKQHYEIGYRDEVIKMHQLATTITDAELSAINKKAVKFIQ
jgi:hypothetical protein